MYRQHFALDRYPFETPASVADLFPSRAVRETATRLRHLLSLRGIGLLTGEAGCGKTSSCRRLVAALRPGEHKAFYVSLTTGSVLDTYQAIGWQLGLEVPRFRAPAWRAIRAEIARLARDARQLPVLIIDEAHLLAHDVLEELRLLTSFRMDSLPRLCLLLVGLGSLRGRLALKIHASLRQRIAVRHHLRGLDRDELEPYLAHRLGLAGCDRELFEPAACEALYQASRGLPREINRLAHFALLTAAHDQAAAVSRAHLDQSRTEVQR